MSLPFFFLSDGSEHKLSTTPQACIIIPDLLLLHAVGEEGEEGTGTEEGEREREQRGRDVKVQTERGAAPGDKAVAMLKKPGGPETQQQHTCRVNTGRGVWREPERQTDATEDERSILTALTGRAAQARQQGRPQEMGEGRRDGRHKEKMFSTSTCVASPSSPPLRHAA